MPIVGEDLEKLEIAFITGEILKWCSCYGKQFDNFLKS